MSRQIVEVGGGAGGLELVFKLARKLKRNADVKVTLIDMNASHIWKPLLHEVANGSLDSNHDETRYRMQARKHTLDVYGAGDCCNCPMENGGTVPPRAQSAHQMASIVAYNIVAGFKGKKPGDFVYKDVGSLISLSRFSTIGNLMGNLMRGTVFVEGWLARMFYLSLYRMHQNAVHGPLSTLLIILRDRIHKATRANLKLH